MLYWFALTNAASYLRRVTESQRNEGTTLTAFQITEVLEIVFCKKKEEIMIDLLKLQQGAPP